MFLFLFVFWRVIDLERLRVIITPGLGTNIQTQQDQHGVAQPGAWRVQEAKGGGETLGERVTRRYEERIAAARINATTRTKKGAVDKHTHAN